MTGRLFSFAVLDSLFGGAFLSTRVPCRAEFWGVSEGMLTTMLVVLAGDAGLAALQEVITVVGLPPRPLT